MSGDSYTGFDEGAAKLWDQWSRAISSNTVVQLRTVTAPPFAPTYSLSTLDTSTATADAHWLQIMAGPLNRLLVQRIRVYQTVAATAATLGKWSLFRLTTAGTGGTSVTFQPLDPIDAATPATAMTRPSAKGTEGTKLATGSLVMLAAAGTVTAGVDLLLLDLDWRSDLSKAPTIAAGASNGLAFKSETDIAGGSVRFDVETTELFWG